MSAGIGRLDVLDAVAAATRGHGFTLRRPLEGIERHPDGAIANRVDHDLPAAFVELCDQLD